ncbi:translation initiation factor 2 subunit 2 [Trichoderma cornu-damae]|uniref:Translation initiation factor 2 subunit 2 n=1 Tax=Trichoderma cornu-damae TaxID=654480 RepID=A0A9P8QW44_9HYPO|nr:translation initiation factor 2 subunit 2 [Trichoderma cornu-damae]
MDNEGQVDQAERKSSRKSVAFTDEQVVVETDGSITIMSAAEEPKETAQSHTPRTPPLSAALGAFTDPSSQAAAADELAPPEDGGLDLSLLKKKKKKKKVEGLDGDAEDGAAPAEDGGLDLTMKKKKKKAKKLDGAEDDEFTAKLKQLEVKDAEDAEEVAQEEEGDMETGTGVWSHQESKTIPYTLLLSRFFTVLSQKNPDHSLSGTKSYKIPPPQCMREGNRKTVFANIADICKRMKRTEEHVTAYLFAELGTNGSVDGNRRLVIKGRFQQKQIENVVRKYIIEYVTCKTCKSPDTELNKGENRLYFITCNNCGSRRSVTAIKTGFSAQIGKRKKLQG